MGLQSKCPQILNSGHDSQSESYGEVRLTSRKSSARNAIERLKSVEDNMVVDSIESRGQINKSILYIDRHIVYIQTILVLCN